MSEIEFKLENQDGQLQKGNTKNMLFPIPELIKEISNSFTLYPGDILLTGTPEGVGELHSGDSLQLSINGAIIATSKIS